MRCPAVLLVEDNPDDAFFAQLAFQCIRPDVHLLVVSNGLHALKYLRGQEPYCERTLFPVPDLVLLDLSLPMMTGFEVLRWIRGQTDLKELPVVVLTGSTYDKDLQRCQDLGASSYIKPFGVDRLQAVVKQITARWLISNCQADSQRKAA